MIRPLSAPTSIRSLALVSTNLEIWHSTTYKTSHHAPQNPANLVCPIKAQATTVRTIDVIHEIIFEQLFKFNLP